MALKRKICAALLAAALLALSAAAALAVSPADYDMSAPQALQAEHLFAQSALAIDADSGEVLFSKNSRVRMYPASTTKIMTLLLAVESGIAPDTRVTIPKEAADIPEGSSQIPVRPGDVTSFRDLLYGFMLSSGNDGANAIAVLVDGSLGAFVDHMNARAAELGCQGTHYVNAHGYHDSDHFTTAQDLALISRAAMQNDTFRDIVACPTWEMTLTRGEKTGTSTIVNRNSLLLSDSKYYYPDCTGIKTGHHRRAGWCFVGSAERDGMRVICVALNCEEEDQKWYDAARLFEYAFTRYRSVEAGELLARAAERFDTARIENASDDDPEGGSLRLELGTIEGAEQTQKLPADSEAAMEAAVSRLADTAEIEWTRPLTAPVEAGERLGTLRCALADGGSVTAALLASRSVAGKVQATPEPTAAPETPPPSPVPQAPGRPGGASLVMIALIALLAVAVAGLIALVAASRRAARRRARRRRRRAARKKV